MNNKLNVLARRYVMVWNETDAVARQRDIEELFSPNVVHFTQSLEARGRAEMEQRIIGSHIKWVRDGGHRFELLGDADGHHNIVRLRWQMIPDAGGPATSAGSDVLILAQDGKIGFDYQFIDQN